MPYQYNYNFDFGGGFGNPPAFKPYTPEEEESALDKILSRSGSLLGWVGQTIDKFGRAVRGTVHGLTDVAQGDADPNWGGGLLNLVPFSDTMGLTDPEKSVQGRDILENFGAPKNIEGFHPIDHPLDALLDVASFGTEVALDPLTYTGVGNLTKLGKANRAERTTGRLLTDSPVNPIKMAPGIKAGEQSLLSFMGKEVFGGERAAQIAEKFIDPLYDKLKFGNPAGRTLNRLFDPSVMEQSDAIGQRLAKEKYYPQLQRQMAQATRPIYEMHDEAFRSGLLNNPQFEKELRAAVEGLGMPNWDTLPRNHPTYIANQMGEEMRKRMGKLLDRAQANGLPVEQLQDAVVSYAARYHHENQGVIGALSNILNAIKPSNLFRSRERKEFLKDIKGGTNWINDVASGAAIGPGGEHIWQLPKEDAVPIVANFYAGVDPDEAVERAKQFVGWIQSKNASDYLLNGKKIYNANALQDELIYTQKAIKAATHAELALESLAASATRSPGGVPEGFRTVIQTLEDMGLTRNEATRIKPISRMVKDPATGKMKRERVNPRAFDPGETYQGAYRSFGDNLIKQGKLAPGEIWTTAEKPPFVRGSGPAPKYKYEKLAPTDAEFLKDVGFNPEKLFEQKKNRFGPMRRVKNAWEGLKDFVVPEEIYQAAVKQGNLWKSPTEISGIAQAFDAIQQFWKASVTQVWPSFHGRNVLGGLYYHWASDAAKGPLGFVDPFKAAYQAIQGAEVDQHVLKATNMGTTSKLLAEARSQGILKAGTTAVSEDLSPEQLLMSGMQGHVPQSARTFKQAVKEGVGKSFGDARAEAAKRISDIPKDAGRVHRAARTAAIKADETLGALMQVGQKTGNFTEDLMRLGHYIAQRSRGMNPQQAAQSVRKWFFDYSELTQFEKNVMKRVFPFYCVPEDSEALTRAGWKKHWEIVPGEEILTYSVENGCCEWQPCLEVASFDHDEDLSVLENSYHKIRFTPNHRWVVQSGPYQIQRAYGSYSYPEVTKIVTGEDLNSGHRILCAAPLKRGVESFLTPEQARLLGWMVTDGYVRWKGQSIEALIYQSPKKFLREVISVAGGAPRDPHPDTGVVAVPVLNNRAKEIEWSLRPENLCWTVSHLSLEAAEAMYDAMYKGDGTVSENRSGDFLAAQKPHVRDAFQILCAILGKRTATTARGICVNQSKGIKVHCLKRKSERYKGKVWCPRTPNGTWVMRQGRLVTITGNTWARKNTPLVLQELIQNPGGKLAQSIRAVNEPREGETYIPEWVGQGGVAIPTGKPGRFLTGLGLPFESALSGTVGPTVGKTVSRNLETTISSMNPLLSGVYAVASQRDPYSGRSLEEMKVPSTGNVIRDALISGSQDPVLMRTPLSRAITTARRLMDTRKGPLASMERATITLADLLTGIKVTDLPGGVEQQKELEGRKALNTLMRSDPVARQYINSHTRFYADPSIPKSMLPPTVNEYLRLQATLEKNAKETAKKKRQQQAQSLTPQQQLLITPK